MTEQRTRTPVVVGVPGEVTRADELSFPVRWAAEEALARGVPLWLVHAYLAGTTSGSGAPGSPNDIGVDADARGPADQLGAAAHQAVRCLEQTADRLAVEYPELMVAMFARCGAAVAVLGDLAVDAGLLVVGRRDHGRVAEAVLGSVTAGLSRRASCPVVAVPQASSFPDLDAPIVVGVDADGPAIETLSFAFSEALARGVPVRFVHCRREGTRYDALRSEEQRAAALDAALARCRTAFPTVRCAVQVVDGDPGEVLTKESVTAGLLVLGPGRGWTGGWRLGRLGPVGHEVLGQATGPVVLLREAGDRTRGPVCR